LNLNFSLRRKPVAGRLSITHPFLSQGNFFVFRSPVAGCRLPFDNPPLPLPGELFCFPVVDCSSAHVPSFFLPVAGRRSPVAGLLPYCTTFLQINELLMIFFVSSLNNLMDKH
jgi:hypothetical protein